MRKRIRRISVKKIGTKRIKKIKRIINNKKLENKVYDIKLKELLQKTDKEKVIDCAMSIMSKKNSVVLSYSEQEFNKTKLKNKKYLSKKYDYFLDLSNNNYSNELSKDNVITKQSNSPFTFGEFLNVFNKTTQSNYTSMFFKSYNIDNVPVELFLDCYISHNSLKDYKDYEIVSRFLLQAIYIEEDNKKYAKLLRKRKHTN